MALINFDRVAETTETEGTGTYNLDGAQVGYRSFSVVGNGNSCNYAVTNGVDWEVGTGVYSANTLTRGSISASSNSGSPVNWSAGTKSVFLPMPAADFNSFAPKSATYLVGSTSADLTAERVVTNTTGQTGITWDLGTAGQAKATADNAGRWMRLASVTASNSAVIDFTGLTSSYVGYQFIFSHIAPSVDARTFMMRTSSNNGVSYNAGATDYRWIMTHNASATAGGIVDTSDSEIHLSNSNQGNAANESICGNLWLHNPSAIKFGRVTFQMSYINTSGTLATVSGSGMRLSAAAVNAVRFFFITGNIASGQIDVFGMGV